MSLVEINQGFRNVNKRKQGFVLENDLCMCLGVWFDGLTNKMREDSLWLAYFFFVVFLGLPLGLTH